MTKIEKRIEVTSEIKQQSKEFAENVIETNVNQYARRNQGNRAKIINDIMVGKVAEFAVYQYYKSMGLDCTQPDTTVYEAKKKSFDADLIVSENLDLKHIHVKSQLLSSAKRYGASWMFQKTDKLIEKPKEVDYIALCLTPDSLDFVELQCILPASRITHLYALPKLPQLYSKRALYWDDVSSLIAE